MQIPTVKIKADTARGYKIVNADDPRNAPENLYSEGLDLTPDGLGALSKVEIVELLEAHGAEVDKRLGVEKLRDALRKIVFIEV